MAKGPPEVDLEIETYEDFELDEILNTEEVRRTARLKMTWTLVTMLNSHDENCRLGAYRFSDYEAGDQAYILRLKVLLFEHVVADPLDHGHKLIRCSDPKDREVVERVRKLRDLLTEWLGQHKVLYQLVRAFPNGPLKTWLRDQAQKARRIS